MMSREEARRSNMDHRKDINKGTSKDTHKISNHNISKAILQMEATVSLKEECTTNNSHQWATSNNLWATSNSLWATSNVLALLLGKVSVQDFWDFAHAVAA